jgi:hypothetical protein
LNGIGLVEALDEAQLLQPSNGECEIISGQLALIDAKGCFGPILDPFC